MLANILMIIILRVNANKTKCMVFNLKPALIACMVFNEEELEAVP